MNNRFLKLALVFMSFSFSIFANASFIIDTGGNELDAGYQLDETQYIAGQFTVSQYWNISSMEAFVSNLGEASSLEFSIWTGDDKSPLTQLFTSEGNIEAFAEAGWYGAYGLNQTISAGTYWVSVIPPSSFEGLQYGDSPDPMIHYARGNTLDGWDRSLPAGLLDFVAVGFRIEASEVSVPEPNSILVVLLGLIGLTLKRFKF